MGVRSDVCIIIEFDKKYKNIVKHFFTSSILELIDDNESFKFLINNFYKTINKEKLQFVFFEEAIKASYLQHEQLFSLIDKFNIENEYKEEQIIKYEHKEICQEFIEDSSESTTNKNFHDDNLELYTIISIGGIPEVDEDDDNHKLTDWLKKN
ncbi:MAG: hypothetical protein ACOC2W_04080 [bacterium]